MLFLFSKEVWQAVRHCARSPGCRSELWFWTAGDFGGDVRLRSLAGDKTLSAVLEDRARTGRGPISVVAASSDLSTHFEHVIRYLAGYAGNLRIVLMVTHPLSQSQSESWRVFLQRNPQVRKGVSSLFLSGRADTERGLHEPAEVVEQSMLFLRLLCQGGESLANSLGIFRRPLGGYSDVADQGAGEEEVEVSEDGLPDLRSVGMLAAFGLRAWIPRKEKIVSLVESLLTRLVAEEEKRASIGTRIRNANPNALITQSLYLGQTDEPLHSGDFGDYIPEPQPSPLATWKVPVSRGRARSERRYLQRSVQRDFSEHTAALKVALDQITEVICQQSATSFAEAATLYRSELLSGVDLGTLSLLVRHYYPAFEATEGNRMSGDEVESAGWLPHESMDCFCQVYDTLEEGLDRLPTAKIWGLAGVLSVALLGGGFWLWSAGMWQGYGLGLAGVLGPIGLWAYRKVTLSRLRQRLVKVSDDTFQALRRAFAAEIDWVIHQTRVQLERDIRRDATLFGQRLQEECGTLPWLLASGGVEPDGMQEEIRQLRAALLGIGVDETQLDQLPHRLEELARRIVERANRQRLENGEEDPTPDPTPIEIVEGWLDELIGGAILPLRKVATMQDEILETAGAWRAPAVMAPLTDAELHRGFRKVVALPDGDIVYHHLKEELPQFSGNPVVTLDVWTGPLPGIAVCSVVTGLSESILNHQAKPRAEAALMDDA